jgi:hypothetical protein
MNRRLMVVYVFLSLCVPIPSIMAQGSHVVVHFKDSTATDGELISVKDSSITLPGALVPAPDLGEGNFRRVPKTLSISKIQKVTLTVEKGDDGSVAIRTSGIILGIGAGAYAMVRFFYTPPPSSTWAPNFAPIEAIPFVLVGAVLGDLLGAGSQTSSLRKASSLIQRSRSRETL